MTIIAGGEQYMAILRAPEYEDSDYDQCGSTTIAVAEFGVIKIPLCQECLNELLASVDKFNNTIFCHECGNFIMSESGWRYGGSCKLKAQKDGHVLKDTEAGYNYCVDCMGTCEQAWPSGDGINI